MTQTGDGHRGLLLQWGRVFDDAEIPAAVAAVASAQVCFNGAASLMTRKSCETAPRWTKYFSLQWGRVFDDAEIPLPAFPPLKFGLLQWGRVFDDAEMFREAKVRT